MTTSLWSSNYPAHFWHCLPDPPQQEWQAAIEKATPILGLSSTPGNIEQLLSLVLGEAQFGPHHWHLSFAQRTYYALKPFLPRTPIYWLRQFYHRLSRPRFQLSWPIEPRYAQFQWEVVRQLLLARKTDSLGYRRLWPENYRSAIVLTHDVETGDGQKFVRTVAALEEKFGFRSSFNFVLERYPLDWDLIHELSERGFEVGVHGLKHDGRLFDSYEEFARRAEKINHCLKQLGAVGFRAPLTHRQPHWMQMLDIDYDLTFFDTDPYEPIPGGTMSIWPFFIGRFVELPYTLAQDSTLTFILKETTPRLWLEKVHFIEQYHGMVLLNTHPDYLKNKATGQIYTDFLSTMRDRDGYWHALPRDVASWWRSRCGETPDNKHSLGSITLQGKDLVLS